MGSLFSLREFRLKYPYASSKKQVPVATSDAKFDFGERKVDIKHKIKDQQIEPQNIEQGIMNIEVKKAS